MTTACPSHEELAQLGNGHSPGSCPPGLATHIEDCPECRKFLERRVEDGLESLPCSPAELPGPDMAPHIDGFTIERELGRGAMGVVYLAHRETPRRHVALKLLPGGRRAGPRERRQWLREAEAASLVRHPNVVTLYEVGEADDWFLLVLEYLPGGTLADRLNEPLAPRNAARLMETIARAVHYIHQCGQLHLDLKPSTILLDGQAGAAWEAVIPKVADFGIARPADAGATDTGGPGPGGTPSYMAPEQITKPRKEMTARADIHGLGAILYHLPTGRPPYQWATVLETIDLVQRHEPIPPRRLNPKIPADLETICLKCLEKDPGRRYASAELLAEDLGRWRDGRPISARPASAVEKSWRWCRRRPVVAALAAALVLTLSVGLVVITLSWRRAEANLRMAKEVLGELVDLSVGGQNGFPKVMTLDRLIPALEKVRTHLQTLSAGQPDDLRLAGQLADVESSLCGSLSRAGRHEDARIIFLESLARLDTIVRQHPADEAVRKALSYRLCELSEVSGTLGKTEDSIGFLARAVELEVEGMRFAPTPSGFATLFNRRRRLAWCLFGRGDFDRALSLVGANLRLSEGTRLAGVSLSLERFLTYIDLKLISECLPSATAAVTAAPVAGDSEPLSRLAFPTDASQPPRQWANLAALALRSADQSDPASAARRESEDAYTAMGRLMAIASSFNQAGKLEEARQIAERMHALATYFVESHRGEPAAHLALSHAYIRLYKNAYKTNDTAAIEANMKLALRSAQTAVGLDPTSETARYQVDSLQRKLAGLHPKPSGISTVDHRARP